MVERGGLSQMGRKGVSVEDEGGEGEGHLLQDSKKLFATCQQS